MFTSPTNLYVRVASASIIQHGNLTAHVSCSAPNIDIKIQVYMCAHISLIVIVLGLQIRVHVLTCIKTFLFLIINRINIRLLGIRTQPEI